VERIPVAGPWITEREIGYVTDAARNGWYGQANAYQQRFESAFAQYLGVRHSIALPSCTAAIHLSLLALGVGPGDEVVVPDLTWIASAAPIQYVGATTVFADVDPLSWCLSADSLEECITPRTKAVIPVDLYGGMPDMDLLRSVAQRRDIAIVEDAAEAVGAEWRGKRAGSFGDTGVFSFHGSKTQTTGEGGMLVTDRDDVRDRVLFLRDHGRRPGDRMFWCTEVAYKYRMTSLQAALGLAQLERIDELLARKRQIFVWYRDRLEGVEGLSLNHEPEDSRNGYWMVTPIWDERFAIDKDSVIAELAKEGIDCRPIFHPLSSLPAYAASAEAARARNRNRVSYRLNPRGINLPSALTLSEAQVAYASDAFLRVLRASASRAGG
jgi:perosamine synthetase